MTSDSEKVEEAPKSTIERKVKPKRVMTPEQLERLAEMRAIAAANREARKAKRDEDMAKEKERREIKKMEKEAEEIEQGLRVKSKLKQLKEKKALQSQESSDDEPVIKKKSKKKKKIAIVADSSSDSETEIVIRKPRRKQKKAEEPPPKIEPSLPPPELTQPEIHSTKSIDELVEEKLSARFNEYRKKTEEDETINLIRQLMPNYKR